MWPRVSNESTRLKVEELLVKIIGLSSGRDGNIGKALVSNNLKLAGKNEEDLKVISAYLQDSIATVKDMVFLKKNRIFLMIINIEKFFYN